MLARRWWRQGSPWGEVTVVAGDRGVRALGLPDEPRERVLAAADALDAEPEVDLDVARVLDAWFEGEDVEVPVDLDGVSGFRRTVLETLRREVRRGETVTYGELAGMAGRPGAARAVGNAMASNPVPFLVPCHRVIASGGRIGGYGGGRAPTGRVALKRELLAREGVFPRS